MPKKIKQQSHLIKVFTPLGDDALILTEIAGGEYVNDLFRFTLSMISDNRNIDPLAMIGKPVSFCVGTDGPVRWFHGIVAHFGPSTGYRDDYRIYRAEIVPEFWFLRHRINCRIFQNKTTPDIIREVLNQAGLTNYELRENGSYQPREYCVQYLESDLDFVTRLIEDEGMFYFHKHSESEHKLIIADTTAAYYTIAEPKMEVRAQSDNRDHLASWVLQGVFLPTRWAHKDYDFETPTKDLHVNTRSAIGVKKPGDYEVFDFPGGYVDRGLGQNMSKMRMEQVESGFKRVTGMSRQYHLGAGGKFTLTRGEVESEDNTQWVCTAVTHRADDWAHITGDGDPSHRCQYEVAAHDTLLRAPRRTKRPLIPGAQTARVVGSGGAGQIYTDKYGRVKVKFHWDRAPETGNDTCWIRCVQPWAGPRFGMSFTPRIGMEVMVLFLDGDPDHPVIAGCIFNGDNMPHFSNDERSVGRETTNRLGITDDRDTKNNSGLFSRSVASKSEKDGNVMRFDDQPGSEEMYIHAQKDLTRSVEHDERIEVDNDQKFEIGHDRKGKIGNNDELKVGVNQTIDVGQNIKITAGMKIELIVGASKITIDNTSIKLEAMMIQITGQATAEMKSPMTTVKGDGMLTLKGGITFIN